MPPQNTNLSNTEQVKIDKSIQRGRILANPPPGEEIVISGLAGRFPDSDDVYQFRDNLFNKVDLISRDDRRWDATHPEIPQRTGKMNDIDKMDAGFFGVHYKQAHSMDPLCRMIMEKSIEAIYDAGVNPIELVGSKTGIFIGVCFSETEQTWFYEKLAPENYAITGCSRSMLANRISYWLKLQGPSFIVDTACSSSLYALEQGYRAIRNGECENAIIGGTNLCLHPYVSLQFARLGVLSTDGACKSFDCTANGYARSEAACAIFLQKAKNSRRVYAQIVHAKTNCDGYKEQGITYPSGPVQKKLLEEFYQECNVDPSTLSFVEAHGTGTKVGDPEEISAIDDVFCTGRSKPLLIGSVKSNIGHTEPASGLCSITKMIIGMESGYIPPNIHYNKPREGVEALEVGRIKVVTEKMPWQDNNGLVGINSFGFGGANCHVLLRWNQKEKINMGQPRDDLPRLICVSGRTENSIAVVLDDLKARKLDTEFVKLYHELFKFDIPGHIYRGYLIISKTDEITKSIKYYTEERSPLYFIFGDYSPEWLEFGRNLFSVPLFAATIQKLHNVLTSRSVNITELMVKNIKDSDVVSCVLVHVATQLALVDIMKTLEVTPNYIVGQSVGVIAAAYADGALTLEQAILCGHQMALWIKNTRELKDIASINVDLEKDKIIANLPGGIEIVDEISNKHVVVSGNIDLLRNYSNSLRSKNIDVRECTYNNLGLHRKSLKTIANKFGEQLKNIIGQPKRWKNLLIDSGNQLASPEFFIGHLTSPISSQKIAKQVGLDGAVVEFGNTSMENALKEVDLPNYNEVVSFIKDTNRKDVIAILKVLGCLYEFGQNPKMDKFYPKVSYPVSRGTPMISPHIRWEHSQQWFVNYFRTQEKIKSGERIVGLSVKEDEWAYLTGHVIDGRNLFPATGYLTLIWEALAMMIGTMPLELHIVFENVKFLRATNVPKEDRIELLVMVQRGSGNFEVIEGGATVVTGRIFVLDDTLNETLELPLPQGINTDKSLPMKKKDIYKELKLRGYNYSGLFKSLIECDNSASQGLIQWSNNWVAFMDNMLQMQILQVDSRNLYVPTSIQRLSIDSKRHIKYLQELGEDPKVPVYVYPENKIIRSGAIEVRGLNASSIAKRKPLGEPVLEKYQFVPNEAKLTPQQSLRVNMQIALENNYSVKVKIVELVQGETTDVQLLGPIIFDVLGDQPLIQPEITILSKTPIEVPNATVEDKKLSNENDCLMVVATNLMSQPQILQEAYAALKVNGFILSRESLDFDETKHEEILTTHIVGNEKLILLRKCDNYKIPTVVDVSDNDFNWLPNLQNAIKTDNRVVIYAQNNPQSGILGLLNCLKREPGGDKISCAFIVDHAPSFNVTNDFYKKQLKKNMAVNVFKYGKWGTYRHLLLNDLPEVEREHCYVNVTVRGDLSSLRWIEGPLTTKSNVEPEKSLINIYYAALNFRDIMTASGRLNSDVITMVRIEQECVQGFEFSGRDTNGKRVFGMVTSGALATLVAADSNLLWNVPDNWTLEDAATVPVVYGTIFYALFERCKLQPGQSILIHAGSGGVGQAAISVALHHGCTVYTTVGTQEKREFIKKNFPQITDCHIGNSRDTSFEQMIYTETNGRGVDVVLNSLAEEKLLASVRCLARGGKFLEIGKFDLASDNPISLQLFEKDASFHGIMLDMLFTQQPAVKKTITKHILEGLVNGSIKPLHRNVFGEDEIEQAFRFMAAGKHMGKVLIRIRNEENEKHALPLPRMKKGIPRYFCNPNHSYVITGGLGGFGMELADWLVLRGARNLVLTSRSGVKNGYQDSRIRTWKSYGVTIKVSTADITTKEGCKELLKEANILGPIEGIFNLAVVLKDAIIENQTIENYNISFGPKAIATKHLDEISRILCPQLRDFVIFSSVSCGRGNPGQSNYGMANSVMERICEKRKEDGLPALAIEWGAIGEVGLVAEMQEGHVELEIGGTLQQRISSCLSVLDQFLRQNEPIVSSMVVAVKKSGSGSADNVVDCVADILGLRNLKTISFHSTLAELGMDSMMAVEIKQTLEREFEVFLTPQDIRSMTFSRLQDIQIEKESEANSDKAAKPEVLPEGVELLLRYISDEKTANIPMIKLASKIKEDDVAPIIFVIPGIEGSYNVLENICSKIKAHTLCLQLCYENHKDTLQEMALELIPQIRQNFPDKSKPFILMAYSFGCTVALEVIAALEKLGYEGKIIFIDGAPEMMQQLATQQLQVDSDAQLETSLLCAMMSLYMPLEIVLKLKDSIYACNNYDERIQMVLDNAPTNTPHSRKYQRDLAIGSYKRLKALVNYKPSFVKLGSKIILYRPTQASIHLANDYKLSEYTLEDVEVKFYEGNHLTLLENEKVAEDINEFIASTVDVNQTEIFIKSSILSEQHDIKHLQETTAKHI